jgi:hypothetical protein
LQNRLSLRQSWVVDRRSGQLGLTHSSGCHGRPDGCSSRRNCTFGVSLRT